MMALLHPDPKSETRAEVMRLHYLEGLSIRAVAKRLSLSRKTVRKHLGGVEIAPVIQKVSRPSLLDSYHQLVQTWLAEAPELRAPQILERLRKQGYTGGLTIVRDLV